MNVSLRFRLVCGAVLLAAACGPSEQAETEAAAELSTSAIRPEWCSGLPRAAYASLDRVDVDSEWFEVWNVGDGVYAIYEPLQWQEVISYLVIGTERSLLFDTGMGIASISDVVRQLTDLPVVVLSSHSHIDHVGGNAEFDAVLAMDTDFSRTRAEGLPNERVRGEVADEALCAPLPTGLTPDRYVSRPWTVTEVVSDGHVVDLGGRSLEIVHIPGHTPDAIALLDAAAGYLWTGDSFYEGPIWLFAPETDLDAYAASVDRLASLAPELTRLFPAHNTPVAEPARLLELRDVVTRIRDGDFEGRWADDRSTVTVDAGVFSILLRADVLDPEDPTQP